MLARLENNWLPSSSWMCHYWVFFLEKSKTFSKFRLASMGYGQFLPELLIGINFEAGKLAVAVIEFLNQNFPSDIIYLPPSASPRRLRRVLLASCGQISCNNFRIFICQTRSRNSDLDLPSIISIGVYRAQIMPSTYARRVLSASQPHEKRGWSVFSNQQQRTWVDRNDFPIAATKVQVLLGYLCASPSKSYFPGLALSARFHLPESKEDAYGAY